MKRFLLALVSAVAVSAPAMAQDSNALGRTRNWACDSCHKFQGKQFGPLYRDIVKKFAGQPFAVDRIAYVIVRGTGAMPPITQVSPTTARELAIWILSLKPKEN